MTDAKRELIMANEEGFGGLLISGLISEGLSIESGEPQRNILVE